MAPRANWKGYLKLALVSCPVALYPASSSSERVSFHLINRDTGHRLKQQYVDSVSGEVVDPEERIRGYEIAKGEYIPVEDDEFDAVALESTHTIEIESFVPRTGIDEVYFDKFYYLAPDDKVAEEPFAVIREAMRRSGMVGLARVVLFNRERILMIEPRGRGLVGTTLRYAYEVRDDKTYFEDIPDLKIAPDMLDLATHIINTKKAKFDPSRFEDRYQDAVVDLIRAKRAGRPAPVPPTPRPSNVVSLMDALRRSVAADKGAPSSEKKPRPRAQNAARKPASRTPAKSRSKGAVAKSRRKAG
jgi:DNA end-binding protein Ku